MAEIRESADNAVVSPSPILLGHADHESLDFVVGSGAAGFPSAGAVVFGRDEFPAPGKQGIGRNDGGDLRESTPTELFGANRESTAVVVAEAESAVTDLLSQDPVLLRQVFDRVPLMLIEPA